MTHRTRHRFVPLLVGLLGASSAWAQTPPASPSPASPSVTVTNAWARATPPGAHIGAVYLTLTSPAGDKLLSVSSAASKGAAVHEMKMDGGVMRMRELPGGLDLPAGQSVTLQPGGNHIMLTNLNAPLKQGQTVPLHLTFQTSAPVDVQAQIGGVGAMMPPTASGSAPAGKMGAVPGKKMP
jgi:copper(I)-binding protein